MYALGKEPVGKGPDVHHTAWTRSIYHPCWLFTMADFPGTTSFFFFLFNKKKTEFVFTYVYTYICMSVCHMCVGTQGVHEGLGAPGAGGTGGYELPQ